MLKQIQVRIYLWWVQFNFSVQLGILFMWIRIAVLLGCAFLMDLPHVKQENAAISFTPLLSGGKNAVCIENNEMVLDAWPVIQKRHSHCVGFIQGAYVFLVWCVGSLSHVYVSSLRALLLGLASNHNLKGVSLDLSNCEVRTPGDCAGRDNSLNILCLFPGKNVVLSFQSV